MAAKVTGILKGHSVEYSIEGTAEEIEVEIADLCQSYPTPGYGTWFNWPPGRMINGEPRIYLAPTDLGNGRWIARGNRSTSCE